MAPLSQRVVVSSYRIAIASLILASSFAQPALAQQPPPSVAELRRHLASLGENRPAAVPQGAIESVAHTLDVAERIEERFPTQAVQWRARAASFLNAMVSGRDPYPEQRNKIVSRGYISPISTVRQGYTVYLPPGYDPSRSYPMMVVLHGGSSNGNLFLGVVLGNNMDWLTYNNHLWDIYEPRWSPDWIVVAPDGFGQVLWRWMGEQDVLDVVRDVKRHYNVDEQRVVLCGLSNGGVGAYSIGERHASEFSAVLAIAGAPTWRQYTGGRFRPDEEVAMERLSSFSLAENLANTSMRAYHGRVDPGPMRPAFFEEFVAHVTRTNLPIRTTWFDLGHDLLYPVHRRGAIYTELAPVVRNPRPREVRVVTGDYRANRQHWLSVTRIADYPHLARVAASVEGETVSVDASENTNAVELDIRQVPFAQGESARIVVDGREVFSGPRAHLGHVISLVRRSNGWQTGIADVRAGELEKRPGLAGPITDAYFDRMIHVYGTRNADNTRTLRQAAERGSRGWPIWLWNYQQQVVADSEVTPEMMRSATLVLYGSPGDNAVLEQIRDRLPIRVDATGVTVGARRFEGTSLGVKMIYPNPLAPNRYVIVQSGVTAQATAAGYNLPDFVPDFVVYDNTTTRQRPRLVAGQFRALTAGYFDQHWQLPSGTVEAQRGAQGPTHAAVPVEGGRGARASHGRTATLTKDELEALRTPDLEQAASGKPREGEATERATMQRGAQERHVSADSTPIRPQRPSSRGGDPREQGWGGTLPIPEAPRVPSGPRTFEAPAGDPAGIAARAIAQRTQRFRNYRAEVAGAVWRVDDSARWSIRSSRACLANLRELDVPARAVPPDNTFPTPIPTPVVLTGRIAGVEFRNVHSGDPVIVACELAVRLHELARIVSRHGVVRVEVLSAYRDHPNTSFHTFGLALDMSRFATRDGVLVVERDYIETPDVRTCDVDPAPLAPGARTLRDIACELFETGHFASVLTPNYNSGHRNHLHVDIRPDDPRTFVR